MAAYEILLLNTAIPQIQAAQSGDTYLCPRELAVVVNTATDAVRITQTGAGNALVVEDSANPDSTPFVVTATGDVGIGTSSPAYKLTVYNNINGTPVSWGNATRSGYLYQDASGVGITDGANTAFTNGLYINTASNYTALYTNANERMRLDSSGNLGLGVTPSAKLEIYSTNNAFNALQVRYNGSNDAMGFGIGNSNGFPYLGYNTKSQAFVDAPVYERSNPAAQLRMDNGSFKFNIAPSGTANTTTITNLVSYTIITSGNQTDFGAANNNVGTVFTANASGTLSSGTVSQNISFTQAMTLDASGNLGVGETSPSTYGKITLKGGKFSLVTDTAAERRVSFWSTANGNSENAYIQVQNDGLTTNTGEMLFATRNQAGTLGERARITQGGYFKASNDGTYLGSTGGYHELRSNTDNNNAVIISSNATNGTQYGLSIRTTNDQNDAIRDFLECQGGGVLRAQIRTNGGLANYQSNNVDLSDIRTKTDISPLASYWNKIAALEIVSYKYKDQTHNDLNIGVIAQQVEQVAPEFVDADGFGETPEDGVPLKTIYNKDLTFAAIKALQEAMARIEKLEAEVAALKGA